MQDGDIGENESRDKWLAPYPSFSATLLPHRSLSRKGFIVLMALASTAGLSGALAFTAVGAWPVTAFLGANVLLLFLTFKLNYRAARLSEEIDLAERELRVTRRHPSGKAESWSFNPYWVRFRYRRRENQADELSLSSHGRILIFGAFLSDVEKESFAAELNAALQQQKVHSSMHFNEM